MALAILALAAVAPPFTATADYFTVDRGDGPTALYVKAVNLGSASPGHFPGEHAIDEATYHRWFGLMTSIGFNAVRVFDLQSPHMYRALARHNKKADRPLYLLQGVWLADRGNPDLYAETAVFDQRLGEAVRAVHGDLVLPKRPGLAHGTYDVDVSPWLLGWVIGREIEPKVIEHTDRAHPKATSFRGRYYSLARGSPSEAWIAARFEHLTRTERQHYMTARPVAAVSWPPLDPLHHTSARHRKSPAAPPGLDDVSLDTGRIVSSAHAAGVFTAYSVYPYHPEFIWREPAHQKARDEVSANPYLGYLRRLKAHFHDRPLLIAEYGVPSSRAPVAKEPITRMHFGGLGEEGQGRALARMTSNIAAAGCAGGAVFSWMDEWWKPTWIVRDLTSSSRRPLWHDVLSPEEHFGLLGFDVAGPRLKTLATSRRGRVRRISAAARHDGLVVRVKLSRAMAPDETLRLAVDSVGGGSSSDEFRLDVSSTTAQLYVDRAYQRRAPPATAPWVPWQWMIKAPTRADDGSLRPAVVENVGRLAVDELVDDALEVNLPWTLLQFADPSQRIAHARSRGATTRSDGVALTATIAGETLRARRYAWKRWSRPPATRERAKPALTAIRRALESLPDSP